VKKQQLLVLCAGIACIGIIYAFGTTRFPQKKVEQSQKQAFSIKNLMETAKPKFTPHQKEHFEHLEADLAKTSDLAKKLSLYDEMINFWAQEGKNTNIASWYITERAKLENSEKSLTFAAQFILDNTIHGGEDVLSQAWKAGLAKELFEKALARNPTKDSLKVGLGACYIFGAGGDNPMEGIGKIRAVLAADSTNAFAHKMLGFGNIQNGQTPVAIERFKKSLQYNPSDVELIPTVALLYKEMGDAANAEAWRKKVQEALSANPRMLAEFEKQFQSLK
jgi:tetratricopeptide (TPR) repeat protein